MGIGKVKGGGLHFINGIAVYNATGSAASVLIHNNAIGPIVLPAGVGQSQPEIAGINCTSCPNAEIRNNTIHNLDSSTALYFIQQLYGIKANGTPAPKVFNNIVSKIKIGTKASYRNSLGYYGASGSNYNVNYSCVFDTLRPFVGTAKSGTDVVTKDPLIGPLFILKKGSPCRTSGRWNGKATQMGAYGGSDPGVPGAR